MRQVLAYALIATATVLASRAAPRVRFVTYDEALATLRDAGLTLPAEFASGAEAARRTAFDRWVRDRDAAVRQRVSLGEEDALVPLLLFGTSYTQAPRLTAEFFDAAREAAARDGTGTAGVERAFVRAFEQRTDDLLRGMGAPGDNERLQWARAAVERRGHRLDTPAGRAAAGRFVVETFARVTRESGEMAAALEATDGDARRAEAFAARGLASDTSWPINHALAAALDELRRKTLVRTGSIRRVAIVGPGLDLVDKDEGHDVAPPRSLQPFAVMDMLLAAGLADPESLRVLALDVSPRVTAHLARAAGEHRVPYDVYLSRDPNRPWTPAALEYWRTMGARVGAEVDAPAGAAGAPLLRIVRVDPRWPARLTVADANVVFQRVEVRGDEAFDLAIATNVLLYYGATEQALAAGGISALLRRGGLLLCNTRLGDRAGSGLPLVHTAEVPFSSRPGDGELIFAHTRK